MTHRDGALSGYKLMDFGKYSYLARRLRSMNLREPFHRVGLWIRHRLDRRRFYNDPQALSWDRVWARRREWLTTPHDSGPLDATGEALVGALPLGWWQDQPFWDSFALRYPEESARLIGMAEEVVAGRMELFQWKGIPLSEPTQWSRTLESEESVSVWASDYFGDIDVSVDPAGEGRDIKWCWELNRFQHLVWLGAAWRLTGSERFAVVARDHVESWLTEVCYPGGVQWQSNLEVGLRALSWARCHILCCTSSSWSGPFMERFLAAMFVHARHLRQELGAHGPYGNHPLGEAAALCYISTLYPQLSEALSWRKVSVAILNRIVPAVILADGIYAEQAFGYLRFVLEFLLPLFHLSGSDESGLSATVLERVAKAAETIGGMTEAFGEMPMIGDSDTGVAIGWRLSDFWDFSAVQASAAVLLERPALAEGLEKLPAESFLMVGDQALSTRLHNFSEVFRASVGQASRLSFAGPAGTADLSPGQPLASTDQSMTGAPGTATYLGNSILSALPPATAKSRSGSSEIVPGSLMDFPSGGYCITKDDRLTLCLDTGPLGLAPWFSHGHADGLSVMVNFDGKPALVDPGTGVYNGSRVWRDYFRSAAAHNTIRVDRADPSRPLGTFRWSGPLQISIGPTQQGIGWYALSGTVDWKGVVHHRVMVHVLGAAILLFDLVRGPGEHLLEWRLHLDPCWIIHRLGDRHVSAAWDRSKLEIICLSHDFQGLQLLYGSMEPMGGWYSRYYGSIQPTTTMLATFEGTLPATALTIIKPSDTALVIPEDMSLPMIADKFADLMSGKDFKEFARSVETR